MRGLGQMLNAATGDRVRCRKEIVGAFGAKIVRVEASEDLVVIATDKGTLRLTVDADCCSESWFVHTDDFQPTGTIIGAEETEWEETAEGEQRQESTQVAFLRFLTSDGPQTLEMRNGSNGYYGGWLIASWAPTVSHD